MTFELMIYAFFVSVDRFSALHLMISRPIVIATIIGLLTGNIYHTFYIGIMLEIFGLIDVQVGTRIPREDSFVAFIMSALVGQGYFTSVSKMLLILLILLILMYVANYSEILVRSINQKIFLRYHEQDWPIVFGVFLSGIRGVLVYSLGFYVSLAILEYLAGKFKYGNNLKVYSVFLTIMLGGYLLRFLSFRSSYKYFVFILGLFLGWLIA